MKSEKGYSFVEILIAVSISALLAVGAGMTTAQIFRSSRQNSDWNVAVRQAQSVGQWISQDALTVSTIDIGDDPETAELEFIALFWKDWENGYTYDTRYLWFDSTDSMKQLKRNQIARDSEGVEISNTTALIADNIYSATLTPQTDSWKLTVETRSGDKSVTREYEISQRLQE
ncbi:MAG: prepilin-type N-terminal cleavage/methylation domain-containing protein [Dehalococcoidales bacterium]|nr:MAG: prepilin-type N-terminal cleavage/methylation domain-containing protein [Dehalococcoidales bacterium]